MTEENLIPGKKYSLQINRFVDFGAFLDAKNLGEILMPSKYIPEDKKEGDFVEVFVYYDSEDRPIATTEEPLTQVGKFAALKVVDIAAAGAFMDWGLTKDLLVPFAEQQNRMEKGETYVVFTYVDEETERIAASSKLDQFLSEEEPQYRENQEVEIMICCRTDMGYKVIIEGSHWGLIYENTIFEPLKTGEVRKAYIAKIREDGKIDVNLNKTGGAYIDDVAVMLYNKLQENDFLPLHDKSSPEEIKRVLGISKKAFKKAVGTLYKKRLITLENNGIKKSDPRK